MMVSTSNDPLPTAIIRRAISIINNILSSYIFLELINASIILKMKG